MPEIENIVSFVLPSFREILDKPGHDDNFRNIINRSDVFKSKIYKIKLTLKNDCFFHL